MRKTRLTKKKDMYDFIFMVIYYQQFEKEKGKAFSKFNGSLIVMVALVIHIMTLYAIIRTLISGLPTKDGQHVNKGLLTCLVLSIYAVVYFYYNDKRTDAVLKKYEGVLEPTSTINYMKVILLLLLPLLLGIYFSRIQ